MNHGEPAFDTERVDNELHIAARRDLVASTVQGQREVLLEYMQPSPAKVVLNLSSTAQLDSLGITLILGIFKSCNKISIPFEVEGVTPTMMRLFQLFSLQKLFPIAAR